MIAGVLGAVCLGGCGGDSRGRVTTGTGALSREEVAVARRTGAQLDSKFPTEARKLLADLRTGRKKLNTLTDKERATLQALALLTAEDEEGEDQ